jgi:hypothetical protein
MLGEACLVDLDDDSRCGDRDTRRQGVVGVERGEAEDLSRREVGRGGQGQQPGEDDEAEGATLPLSQDPHPSSLGPGSVGRHAKSLSE